MDDEIKDKDKKVDEDWKREAQKEKEKENINGQEEDDLRTFPEASFMNFLMSLATQAVIQLGEVEHPVSKAKEKDLPAAKYTIDLIQILKEKTQGNLTNEEARALESILYDLRMRYVTAVRE